VAHAAGKFVGHVHLKTSFCADNLIARYISGAKATCKTGQAIVRENQHCRGHFFDLCKPLFSVAFGNGKDSRRLVLKKIPGRINAIDPDVVQSAPAESFLQANVALLDLHRKQRVEYSEFAQLARLSNLDSFQVGFFKMEPVSNHQLHTVFPGRCHHLLTFKDTHRHGLFAQYMDTRFCSPHREITVKMIWQCNVNCIHFPAIEAFVIPLI
jgi:hypothetical protein